jgi:hypothetical protein
MILSSDINLTNSILFTQTRMVPLLPYYIHVCSPKFPANAGIMQINVFWY